MTQQFTVEQYKMEFYAVQWINGKSYVIAECETEQEAQMEIDMLKSEMDNAYAKLDRRF